MKRMIFILILMISVVYTKATYAQGESAVPFLLLAPDSRAGGIGESGAGLADNSAAIFWNPAGIAFLTGSEVSFTHSNWLPQFQLDLFYDYATYRQYIDDLAGSVTASVTYMNFGEFVRTSSNSPDPIGTFRSFDAALTLGYATKVSTDWGLGFNFRLIHSRLSDKPTEQEQGKGVATSVSFDVATMWRPSDLEIPFIGNIGNKFSVGINLSNIGPKIYYIDQAQADPIPTNFRLGFATRFFEDDYNSLTMTLDFSKLLVSRPDSTKKKDEFYKAIFTAWADQPLSEELRDVVTSMGLEYWYGIPEDFMFALRLGFFYEDPAYGNRKFATLGAGIRYDLYGFDFSYITTDLFKNGENHPLSNTLRFTLLIGWGNTTIQKQGFPRGI
ncbi:MAG: type IX secretion system outer membrane channel protein PorV [Ignavibacteriaceae bacterium]|jgi:hypothetical protein|nr:type IX secretion system outer membrane channel protein PorV [Ignavibacteriaceae bacterium]